MLGASADQIDRKLDEAQQLLTDDDPDEGRQGSDFGLHYSEALLTMQTAICQKEAGSPATAVETYAKVLSRRTFSRRDYGYFSCLMADALALAGEPDEAARVGLQALGVARSTDSTRTLNELRQLLRHLDTWSRRSAVAELQEAVLV